MSQRLKKVRKIDHLLRFFESYSIFISTIVLSALSNNRDFYNEYKNKWRDSIKDPWITQSSFGNWNNFYDALRKFLIDYLNDDSKKKREVLFDLLQQMTHNFMTLY